MSCPAWLSEQISDETQYLKLDGAFELETGEQLDELVIAYRTWGNIENADRRAILICHALTGSADVDAWWPGIIGADGAFDPRHDFIVCANILGSCYGTTGPVSSRPGDDAPYRAGFPRISVRDMVNAQALLLDHLDVQQLELVTGPSLGGMQALEWALMFPDRVSCVVPIGVGGQHSAWCVAISEAQRAAIAADPNWQGGYYDDATRPDRGLAAARMMAICTYRSSQSFNERFGRQQDGQGLFDVQSYLNYQGDKINSRFDANTYVTLTHAMHTHDLARDRGDYAVVLDKLRQAALVVSVSSDALYPPEEQRALAAALPNAQYAVLDSAHGHDGFLIETDAVAKLIAEFRVSCAQRAGSRQVSNSVPGLPPRKSLSLKAQSRRRSRYRLFEHPR
jgi:homoserine O-acetyltransferase